MPSRPIPTWFLKGYQAPIASSSSVPFCPSPPTSRVAMSDGVIKSTCLRTNFFKERLHRSLTRSASATGAAEVRGQHLTSCSRGDNQTVLNNTHFGREHFTPHPIITQHVQTHSVHIRMCVYSRRWSKQSSSSSSSEQVILASMDLATVGTGSVIIHDSIESFLSVLASDKPALTAATKVR